MFVHLLHLKFPHLKAPHGVSALCCHIQLFFCLFQSCIDEYSVCFRAPVKTEEKNQWRRDTQSCIYLAFIYLQMATYTGRSIPNMGN